MNLKAAYRIGNVEEYYFSRKLKEIKQRVKNGEDIINLGIGNPDMDPDPSVLKATAASLAKSGSHTYQSYIGSEDFRNAIANWYRRFFNVKLDINNQILPLMGSKEGIMHISMAFLNPGDKVLIPDPGYPTYNAVSSMMHAETVTYDLLEENNWQPDFDALEEIDLSQVKLMWVNYPNMPTGADASDELFERLIAFGLKHHILIVNDNPYSFILNEKPRSIMQIKDASKTAIELNSLSKSFNMAGWRIGMVVGSEKILRHILNVKSNMDSGMFLPIQAGAIAALNLKNDWFDSLNQIYRKRRKLVYQILDCIGCNYDRNGVGMFVWAKTNRKNAEELSEELLNKAGVFITPGSVFGNNGIEYLRISLCTPEPALNRSIQKLKNAGYDC
jgi:aspartate/methionine/tyrosine aminotransferase